VRTVTSSGPSKGSEKTRLAPWPSECSRTCPLLADHLDGVQVAGIHTAKGQLGARRRGLGTGRRKDAHPIVRL